MDRTTISGASRLLIAVLAFAQLACQGGAAGQVQGGERRYQTILDIFREAENAALPLVPLEEAWTLRLAEPPTAPGALDAERVYIPVRGDRVVALERETGRLVWTRDIASTVAPLAADGLLFVAAPDTLHAIEPATGRGIWSAPLPAPLTAPLVWDSGWLAVPVDPGELLAYRAADGHLVWKRSLPAASVHRAAAGGDRAWFLTLADGRVVAVAADTGETIWERTLSGTLSEPAATAERVFVGSTDNFFYALDARSGAERWKWRNGGDVIGATVDRDVVYFASLDNIIRAVNHGNGNQRWRRPTGTRPVLPPVAFRGVVVLAGIRPAITAFAGASGEVMGTQAVQGDLLGAPLVDRSPRPSRVALVTVTREGVVEAFRPAGLLFREGAPTPMAGLPGRPLAREPTASAQGM